MLKQAKLTKWLNGQEITIDITIDEDGKMTSLVNGIVGPGCEELTKFLNGLGVVVVDDPTPDFYQQEGVMEYAHS